MRLVLVLLALSSSGCAPQPLSPARANEDWLRLETEHFELSTNLPPEQATRAAAALERTRVALLAAAWNRPADAGRITSRTAVVVLRDQADFEHYSHRGFDGFFSPLPWPMIFLHGSPETWERRVVRGGEAKTSVLLHEVTHQLVAGGASGE